jgi:large subunit ribosomal protein L16
MKQNPSNIRYRKSHKANYAYFFLTANRQFFPINGNFALKSLQAGKLTFKQIEAGRRAIRRSVKKLGTLSIRVFPYISITKKPLATRMGKGKGSHYK